METLNEITLDSADTLFSELDNRAVGVTEATPLNITVDTAFIVAGG